MRSIYTKEELIRMLHNSQLTILRGLKPDATEEEKATANILLFGNGREVDELLESLVDAPESQDEEELIRLREQLDTYYGNSGRIESFLTY